MAPNSLMASFRKLFAGFPKTVFHFPREDGSTGSLTTSFQPDGYRQSCRHFWQYVCGLREDLKLSTDDLRRTPLALFTYCKRAMATKPNAKTRQACLWNADTVKSYLSMMEKMQACYFDGLGLCFGDLEFEHLAAAVDAYEENSRAQKLSDSTREKLKSILKSLTAFVHEKLLDHADPCWGSSWSYMPSAPLGIGGKKGSKEQRRQEREQEIDEIVHLPRSLQIVEESKFAHALRDRLLRKDGIAMGGLLMLYLGLRPGECCGLT